MAEHMMRRDMCPKPVSDYAIPFALWDLHLYLDTHPDCEKGLAMLETLCAQMGEHDKPCACRIPRNRDGHFAWIDGPWPWEFEANAVNGAICAPDNGRGCGCERR